MGLVYKITNMVSGQSYIGATTDDFDRRYQGGRWWAQTHNHRLQDDAYHFGEGSFRVEVLQHAVPDDQLAEVEYDLIRVHDTLEPKGYNTATHKQHFQSREDPEEKRKRLDKLRRERLRREFYEQIQKQPFTLSAALKSFRAILGYTQEKFADFQDVAVRTLREIEWETGNPTVETIQKLLRGSGLIVAITSESNVEKVAKE